MKEKDSYEETWEKRLDIKQNITLAMSILSMAIATIVLLMKIVI